MSLADQSPCTSWLAQYERTEACRAALALDVSGWPASRSAMAPRLTPTIKQIAQQSRVSLRTRGDMPRPVAFGLTRPPRGRGDEGLCTVTTHLVAISCAMRACGRKKLQLRGAGKVLRAQQRKLMRRRKKTSSTVPTQLSQVGIVQQGEGINDFLLGLLPTNAGHGSLRVRFYGTCVYVYI